MIRSYGGRRLQFAEVSAVVTHADGTTEDLGVLARQESLSHRLNRWARRAAALLSLAALAYGLSQHSAAHVLPAATVIVNGGQAIDTNLISGLGGTVPKFVGWGTGAGTAAITDTTLFSESADETRATGTASRITTNVTNDTYQVVGTMTVAVGNKTITNVGLFDAVSSGNLYLKADFTGQALLIGDSITFTIKNRFS